MNKEKMITEPSPGSLTMTMMVLSEADKTCQVGQDGTPCIDCSYEGPVPMILFDAANRFGDNPNIRYDILTPKGDNITGNCNSSSSTLLKNAGVSTESINKINEKIKGNAHGFGDIKPWTKDEQQQAVDEKDKNFLEKMSKIPDYEEFNFGF